MDNELLQSFVRTGDKYEEDPEPSRLYPPPKQEKEKKKKSEETSAPVPSFWGRRRNIIVIEQRQVNTVAKALDECYCDKDRAAAVSFGYVDIKQDLKSKQSQEKQKVRIMPDESDAAAFLMLGMREIKNCNTESGLRFLNKVFTFVRTLR